MDKYIKMISHTNTHMSKDEGFELYQLPIFLFKSIQTQFKPKKKTRKIPRAQRSMRVFLCVYQ